MGDSIGSEIYFVHPKPGHVKKITRKNKASDTINKSTTKFNPLWTARL
jgi:hypothetical protein